MLPSHRSPTHPGEMLLEEFLKPANVTQVIAAKQMHMPLNRLNEIIHAKRGVSADSALLFSKLTGTSAEFWLSLQAAYDLWHAQQAQAKRHVRVKPLAVSA